MWEPAAEHEPSLASSWQWILQSTWTLSCTFGPLVGGERFVRIKSRANPSYVVSAHPHRGVVLMPLLGCDARQLWMVDESWRAQKGFALVNKATGQALCHREAQEQVSLTDYDPTEENEKILWTLGPDAGQGYFALKAPGSNPLYLDISEEKVSEGKHILAYDWKGGLHQMWGLEPLGLLYTIRSRLSEEHALSADLEAKVNFPEIRMKDLNEDDPEQLWTIESHFDQSITIRNVASKLSIRGPCSQGERCRLGEISQAFIYNLWLLGKDEGECYFFVRAVSDLELCLDATEGKVKEGCGIITHKSKLKWPSCQARYNQLWGFFPKGGERPIKPI